MKKNLVITRLQQALDNDELFAYLVGEKGYKYDCPYADMPTYDEVVFKSINDYSMINKSFPMWEKFQKTWIEVSANKEYSWFSLYYLYLYLIDFSDINSGPIPMEITLKDIVANLQSNKKYLIKNQKWIGRGLPDGLWENATRMAVTIKKRFNVSITIY